MLQYNTTPPTNSRIAGWFHPGDPITIAKPFLDKYPRSVRNNRIFSSPTIVGVSNQHIIRYDRTYSATAENPPAHVTERIDQTKILVVAREQPWVIKRSVEVRRRRDNQRNLSIEDFLPIDFSDVTEKNAKVARSLI